MSDEIRTFMLRMIPLDLHKRWKMIASMKDISMEEFAMEAIEAHIITCIKQKEEEALQEAKRRVEKT